MILLRKSEYYFNSNTMLGKLIFRLLQIKQTRISTKLGFFIPINVFDIGLYIPHHGSIVVNPNTKCGKYCLLHNNVVIGQHNGMSPTIGNNVFIGTGAKIFGDIIIADNVWIGANSVVNKSVLKPNSFVAGIPAKLIGFKDKPWNETEHKG
jgi:serine O-acetyltransferase